MSKLNFAIALLFCLFLIPLIYAKIELETVYSLQFEISRDDSAVLEYISSAIGVISHYPTTGSDYSIKVLDQNNRELFERNFKVLFVLNLEPLRTIALDKVTNQLRVPYFDNAKRIVIYHADKEILNIDLSEELCNQNFFCDLGENKVNCPDDCFERKGISLFWIITFSILLGLIFNYLRSRK